MSVSLDIKSSPPNQWRRATRYDEEMEEFGLPKENIQADFMLLAKEIESRIYTAQRYIDLLKRLVHAVCERGTANQRQELEHKVAQATKAIDSLQKLLHQISIVPLGDGIPPTEKENRKQLRTRLSKDFTALYRDFSWLSQKVRQMHAREAEALDDEKAGLLTNQREEWRAHQYQDDLADDHEVEFNARLSREVNEHVVRLSQDVMTVSDMFKALQGMVNDQGRVINSFEERIVGTHGNVKNAHSEMLITERNEKRKRKRNCCFLMLGLFAVLIISLFFWAS